MEGTIMEVNLCPSSNIGKASCSVHSNGNEGQLFHKTENQAIVHLEHSVTAICPENGEIQYMTIIPDKNVEHSVKDVEKDRRRFISKDTSRPAGYSVNELRTRNSGLPSSFTGHKSLLSSHDNASLRAEVYDYNDKDRVRVTYPVARKEDLSDHDARREIEIDSTSKSRKRQNVEEWDSGCEDEKKPRKNKQWSRINMLKAIAAVQNGMRIRRAAKQFAVPRTTLKYKLDSQTYRREPESMELSKNLNEKVVTKATEECKDSKGSKQDAQTLQETQVILKRNEIEGQKNTDTKECLNISKKPSTVSCNNNNKSANNDLPLQHSRSLRSNSRILDNKVVQLNELTDNKKPVNLQVNKNKTEVKSLDSNQKSKRTNDSMFDKELRNRNEKKLNTNEEMKFVERKCFKLWSEEAMKKAISAVEQGSKIREAATVFGVPRSTLGRKISSALCRTQSLAVNQQSKPQANDLEVQFLGIRQSPRRQKSMPAPVTSGIKSLLNTPCLIPTSERKGEEKSKDVNAPERKKDDTAKDRGRQRAKNWSEESMGKALEAVDQGMSLRSAAIKFNLPPASLKTRKYKRDCLNNRFEGPEPHITTEDEDAIVNYVNDCATFGIINVKEVALLLAAEAAEKQLIWDIKKQGLPSDEWWISFCTRRGSHIKNVDVMQANNKIKVSEGRLGLFYDKLSAIKNGSQYHKTPLANCSDCRTFTVQEFKYDLNAVTEWVSEGADTETYASKMLPETDPSNKLISAICCASAAGNSIPPMFVYHTENNYKIPATGLVGPFGAVHFVHNVHDMTRKSDFYFKWFSEVFLKYAPQSRPLIVLFDPDTAFITPEFIQLAHKNEIILLGLPPFSAHIIQPLNRKVFPALKKGFSFTSSLFKRIFVKGVNFNNFARCFKVAWNSSVDAAIIKAGFAEAGIHPINRKVILKSTKLSL